MAVTLALGADAVRVVIAVFTGVAVLARVTLFTLDTARFRFTQF